MIMALNVLHRTNGVGTPWTSGLYLQIRKSAGNPAPYSENCGISEFLSGIFSLTHNTLFLINTYIFYCFRVATVYIDFLVFLNRIDTGLDWYFTIILVNIRGYECRSHESKTKDDSIRAPKARTNLFKHSIEKSMINITKFSDFSLIKNEIPWAFSDFTQKGWFSTIFNSNHIFEIYWFSRTLVNLVLIEVV